MVVDRIEKKLTPERAAELGILDLKTIKEEGIIHILTMDKSGRATGVTNQNGLYYYYANSINNQVSKFPSTYIEIKREEK